MRKIALLTAFEAILGILVLLFVSCAATRQSEAAEPRVFSVYVSGLEPDVSTTKHGNLRATVSGEGFLEETGLEYGDIVEVRFLDKAVIAPIVPSYASVPVGQTGIALRKGVSGQYDGVLTFFCNMADFITSNGIAVKTTDEDGTWRWNACEGVVFPLRFDIVLAEKGGFLAQLALSELTASVSRSDYAGLDDNQFANFRQVRTSGMGNVLFRSSSPLNEETGRSAYVMKALEDAGVTVIVNAEENQPESESRPSFPGSYYSKQKVFWNGMSAAVIGEANMKAVADALRFMAENPGVYCIHCKEGKDRTGFLCAVLELLMGAGMDEIIADYMETYCNFFGVEKGSERYAYISSIITDELAAVGIGREGNLQKQTADFLKRIGLSSDEVETLKKNLSVL